MSETRNGTAALAVDRAESLLDRLGERLKETGARLQEKTAPPAETPAAAPVGDRPATERAEETLDRAGEQIGALAAALSHRVRKSLALAREGAEDIWAEAQALRRQAP